MGVVMIAGVGCVGIHVRAILNYFRRLSSFRPVRLDLK